MTSEHDEGRGEGRVDERPGGSPDAHRRGHSAAGDETPAATVADLDARRRLRTGTGNVTCSCGSEWWTTPGVVVSLEDDSVTGYVTPLTCLECGVVRPE